MSRQKSGLVNIETFTIKTTSPALAQRFRDYCYTNKVMIGSTIESLMVDFLIDKGIVESKEALEIEDALTK